MKIRPEPLGEDERTTVPLLQIFQFAINLNNNFFVFMRDHMAGTHVRFDQDGSKLKSHHTLLMNTQIAPFLLAVIWKEGWPQITDETLAEAGMKRRSNPAGLTKSYLGARLHEAHNAPKTAQEFDKYRAAASRLVEAAITYGLVVPIEGDNTRGRALQATERLDRLMRELGGEQISEYLRTQGLLDEQDSEADDDRNEGEAR